MSGDPFSVLGVAEDASDADIKRAYLALVRRHSPEREPERFETIRAAYEAVADPRRRLERRWLKPDGRALHRLKQALLAGDAGDATSNGAGDRGVGAPRRETLDALLVHCAKQYARRRLTRG